MLLEMGSYNDAIPLLASAVNLSDQYCETLRSSNATSSPCSVVNGLNQCLSFGRNLPSQLFYQKRRQTRKTLLLHEQRHQTEQEEKFYVFQEPIRIPSTNNKDGSNFLHPAVIRLVIAFNLALANHLRVRYLYSHEVQTIEGSRQALIASLKLYELVASLLCHLVPHNGCSGMGILRFSMALCNNLGEIHRMLGNHEHHRSCLQELLSTTMVLVSERSSTTISHDSSTVSPGRPQIEDFSCSFELEGFLRNTTSLVLHDYCACQA